MTVVLDEVQARQIARAMGQRMVVAPLKTRQRTITLDESSLERLSNWALARRLVYHNPLFGVGYWNQRFLGAFGFSTVHNFFLALLIDTGILGLLSRASSLGRR